MRHALQPTALAAGIVASLIGVSAHAATQAELQQIQLYSGVTIAQDSVKSWGPWEQFEAPAAGNRLPMPSFGSDISNLYRPIPPVVPPTEPPVVLPDQQLSGFGVFLEFNGEGATRSLTKIDATLSGATAPGTTSPATVSAAFTPIITPSIPFDSTGTLNYLSPGAYANAEGTVGAGRLTDLPGIDSDAIQAWPVLVTYLNGQSGNVQTESSESGSVVMMYGVVGRPTSNTDMSALRSGNFSATYTGKMLASSYDLSMKFNFGAGSGQAIISGDSKTWVFTKFGINGATASSTNVVAGGASVSGSMQVLFTGASAAGAIGVANVTANNAAAAAYALRDGFAAKQTSLTQTAAPTSVTIKP